MRLAPPLSEKNYGAVEDVFSSTHLRSSISVLDVSRTVVPHVSSVMVGGPLQVTGISDTPAAARFSHAIRLAERVEAQQGAAIHKPARQPRLDVLKK